MMETKGQSIFSHSRSSTSEDFALFIIKYMLFGYLPAGRRVGQVKPVIYCALSALRGNL
jgi:hypothetical protein